MRKLFNFYCHFEIWQMRQFEGQSASLRQFPKKNQKWVLKNIFAHYQFFFRFGKSSNIFAPRCRSMLISCRNKKISKIGVRLGHPI